MDWFHPAEILKTDLLLSMNNNINSCPILLINLNQSTGRLLEAQKKLTLAGVNFERIEAVDGRLLNADDLNGITEWDKNKFFKPLSAGEIGCFLSHIAAVERIVSEGWPMAVVLEDDFELHADFNNLLSKIVNSGDSFPDLIKLEGILAGGDIVKKITKDLNLVRHRRPPVRTVAQLWTLEGAKKFLAIAHPLRRPVDVQLKHWWEGDLNILTAVPALVTQDTKQSTTSTIGARHPVGLTGKIRQYIYRFNYAFLCQWQLFRRYGWRSWWRANRG